MCSRVVFQIVIILPAHDEVNIVFIITIRLQYDRDLLDEMRK